MNKLTECLFARYVFGVKWSTARIDKMTCFVYSRGTAQLNGGYSRGSDKVLSYLAKCNHKIRKY